MQDQTYYVTFALMPKAQKLAEEDRKMLEMALLGYGAKLEEIVRRMSAIEKQLKSYKSNHRPKYRLNPQARKRISAAQKKRWQKYRKQAKMEKVATKS